jgi:hypothetical protein
VALGLAAALIASVVFGTSAVLQAVGARKAPAAESLDPRLYTRLLQQPAFVAALVLNLVGFVLHLSPYGCCRCSSPRRVSRPA